MAQNPQLRSHPSAILTYAHGLADFGRGRFSRSSIGIGASLTGQRLAAEVDRHAEPGHLVDLGQRGGQFVAVALGHAAGDDESGAVLALILQRQDGVDRLLAGLVDERAGVDDDEIGERRRRRWAPCRRPAACRRACRCRPGSSGIPSVST